MEGGGGGSYYHFTGCGNSFLRSWSELWNANTASRARSKENSSFTRSFPSMSTHHSPCATCAIRRNSTAMLSGPSPPAYPAGFWVPGFCHTSGDMPRPPLASTSSEWFGDSTTSRRRLSGLCCVMMVLFGYIAQMRSQSPIVRLPFTCTRCAFSSRSSSQPESSSRRAVLPQMWIATLDRFRAADSIHSLEG